MAKKYRLSEKKWLSISQALLKKPEDGKPKITELWKSGDCPICGSKSEDDKAMLVVDNEKLHFITKCCSTSGGPMNFCMITRKCTLKEAIDFLEDFVE